MALTTNLVSYWKLDEASGNAADSVGSNTGVNTNVTYAACLINNGGIFNGTAYLKPGTTGFATGAGARTINFWVYKTTTSLDIIFGDNGNTGSYFGIYINNLRIVIWNNTDSDTGLDITLNAWHMITLTYDGTNAKVYLNAGTPYSVAKTLTTSYETTGVYIGATHTGAAPLTGKLDEIGYWTRALSVAEITELYNGGAGKQYPFLSANTTNFFQFI